MKTLLSKIKWLDDRLWKIRGNLGARWCVAILLVPPMLFGVCHFGPSALFVLAVSILTCMASGIIARILDGKPFQIFYPASIITGALIAMTVRAETPIYMVIIGGIVAEYLGRDVLFKKNPFNPAVLGRTAVALLELAEPQASAGSVDIVTSASVLFKEAGGHSRPDLLYAFLGFTKGAIGETSTLILLVCGFFLLRYVVVKREATIALLVATPSLLLALPPSAEIVGHAIWVMNPLYYMVGGSTLLTAFFFATDPSTTPNSKLGGILFGIGVAIIGVAGKLYTSIPGFEMFGILVMNLLTPWLEKATSDIVARCRPTREKEGPEWLEELSPAVPFKSGLSRGKRARGENPLSVGSFFASGSEAIEMLSKTSGAPGHDHISLSVTPFLKEKNSSCATRLIQKCDFTGKNDHSRHRSLSSSNPGSQYGHADCLLKESSTPPGDPHIDVGRTCSETKDCLRAVSLMVPGTQCGQPGMAGLCEAADEQFPIQFQTQPVDSLLAPTASTKELPTSIQSTKLGNDYLYGRLKSFSEYPVDATFPRLRKLLIERDTLSLIEKISESGLTGCGGAHFSVAAKWKSLRAGEGNRCLIVNGMEGEPDSFKDLYLMTNHASIVVEGAAIAALSIEAEEILIVINANYKSCFSPMSEAIARLSYEFKETFAGKISLVKGPDPELYVCGEESSLIAYLEGRRAEPGLRPPFPSQCGLHGRPTLIHNVETVSWIPIIVGDRNPFIAKARKLLSVSGEVSSPGVYEVEIGTPLWKILEAAGGMASGKELLAVQVGGISAGFLPPARMDLELENRALMEAGAMLGCGSVKFLSSDIDILEVVSLSCRFMRDQSCGRCTPCRVGTQEVVRFIENLIDKKSTFKDREWLKDVIDTMRLTSNCGLGVGAPGPILSLFRYWPATVDLIADQVSETIGVEVCSK